jgi:hypothetical protein
MPSSLEIKVYYISPPFEDKLQKENEKLKEQLKDEKET